MSNTPPLRPADACAAILDMAARRGLHASSLEAETALRQIDSGAASDWLAAAWAVLFPGHTANLAPFHLVHSAQLPAWVLAGGRVGVLSRIDADAGTHEVQWIGGEPAGWSPRDAGVLVPVSPALLPPSVGAAPSADGIATSAIKAALKAHRPLFLRAGLASVLMNLLAIGSSLFSMQVYDRVIPNFAEATLWVLASGVVLALVFEVVFKLLRLKMLESSALRIDEAVSLYFFEKLMALKIDRRPPRVGSLVAQFRDYDAIKNFFTSTTLFMLADLPFIFMFIAIIGLIGGPVAWVVLGFVLVSVAVGFAAYRPIARLQREETDESARRLGLVFEAVAGGEMLKATAAEPRFSDVWQRSTRAAGRVSSDLRSVNAYAQFAVAFFQQLAFVGIIIVGVYVIEAGELTMGGLIACSILAGRALTSISQVTQLLLQWHHARYALKVLNEILARPTDDDDSRQANSRSVPLAYSINALRYAYGDISHPQLTLPRLQIEAGARLAVIGHNGSGKSTLLKLLCGIATPNEGQVTLAGLDLQRACPSWIRETVGYLPQEVRLFSGTLRENLTIGISAPSEEAIFAAMEKTGLLRTLSRHPEGLNLQIQEGGAGLSGGQRQLVGLTRLVLQQPKVWLLDEPSASLDSDAENALIRMLGELPAECSVIFTSHRPAWLGLARRVLLLENGMVKVDAPADQVRRVQVQNSGGGEAIATGKTALPGAAS